MPSLSVSLCFSSAGPGLFNNDNTCYLNSTFQCPIHTPLSLSLSLSLWFHLISRPTVESESEQQQQPCRLIDLKRLLEEGGLGNKTCSTVHLPSSHGQNSPKTQQAMEDAHEYLCHLLDICCSLPLGQLSFHRCFMGSYATPYRALVVTVTINLRPTMADKTSHPIS